MLLFPAKNPGLLICIALVYNEMTYAVKKILIIKYEAVLV